MTEPDDHRMLRYLKYAVPLGEHPTPYSFWTGVRLDVLQWAIRKLQGEPQPVKVKMAPVQGFPPGIPWDLHLEAYAAYSKKWSPQPALIDLEGRNCRGGFGTEELDGFIPGWRHRISDYAKLQAEVERLKVTVPAGVLLAITNAGLTLTQTQQGYELRKLGEVKAQ